MTPDVDHHEGEGAPEEVVANEGHDGGHARDAKQEHGEKMGDPPAEAPLLEHAAVAHLPRARRLRARRGSATAAPAPTASLRRAIIPGITHQEIHVEQKVEREHHEEEVAVPSGRSSQS